MAAKPQIGLEMIKADGKSTRAGAFVNGATLVKDEQSDIWATCDGNGIITVSLSQKQIVILSSSDASILSELLCSLVRREYAPCVEIEEVTTA